MNISDKFLQSKEFDLWVPQISRSSPECGTFLLCCRDKHAQCPTVQKTGDSPGTVLGRLSTRPLLCNDGVMVQTVQKTVLVRQLQFIDVGSIRCDHAAPSSNSFPYTVLSWFFALFKFFFSDSVHLDVESRLSADILGSQTPRCLKIF